MVNVMPTCLRQCYANSICKYWKYWKNVPPVIHDGLDKFKGSLQNNLWKCFPLKTKAF